MRLGRERTSSSWTISRLVHQMIGRINRCSEREEREKGGDLRDT